jgi:hypothetical protein
MATIASVSQLTPSALPLTRWLKVIRAEYREMPGLCLTKPQIRRLWSLDTDTCDALVETLESEQFLKRVGDEYVLYGNIYF